MKVNQRKEKLTFSVWSNTQFVLKDIVKYYKPLFGLMIISTILGVILPYFEIYLPKLVVQIILSDLGSQDAISTMVMMVLLFLVLMTIEQSATSARYLYTHNMSWHFMRKLFLKTLNCDYVLIESAKGHTKYQKARRSVEGGEDSCISLMITSVLSIFRAFLCTFIFIGIITKLNLIIVGVVVVITILNYFALDYAKKYEQSKRGELAKIENKLDYVENICGDVKAAKDVRIYHLADWFMTVHTSIMQNYARVRANIQNHYFLSGGVDALTLLLRDCIAYVYLIHAVQSGQITIEYFVLCFGAITGLSAWISQIIRDINTLGKANIRMNDLREFLESTDAPEPEKPKDIPSKQEGITIEFRDVCYSYGQGSRMILDHFNLTIEASKSLALVGVNGAGKTTLVKLLCGLYQPDSGEILINGTNIREYSKKELFKLYAVVFQDIMLFPFTVAENVSMQTEERTDKKRVTACLERVGLLPEILKAKKGMDTLMTKYLDAEGVVLSGGQQQKLLMARLLYKDAPILILDEPTAALDPIAENEVYENFHAFSRGKTSIFISHRLSSTRFCDTIIMLKDGKIVESGTHEQLLEKQGIYAEMYHAQSVYYNNPTQEV